MRLSGRTVLIGLVIGYVGLLVLWPLAAVLQGAFAEGAGGFVAVLADPEVQRAFGLTIALAAGALVVNAVLGLVVAWVLVRHDFRGRAFFNGIVDLPFVVSPVIAGYMVILLFGRRGWLAPLVEALDLEVVFAVPGMLLVTIFVALPFVVRELMPVLQEIGPEPEQTAYTLGASGWQTFRRVTLPGIRWGLAYGLTLTLARALGEFGAVLVVGGAVSGRTETATLFIFRALEERQYTGAYAAAIVLALVSFAELIGMGLLRRRSEAGGRR
jgi:sulfate transport system permease protein